MGVTTRMSKQRREECQSALILTQSRERKEATLMFKGAHIIAAIRVDCVGALSSLPSCCTTTP